ncbi:uncharacterized protein BX664DRAFT_387491 [Halteromyces radiatus]|uniref:uncharacterized protein n=1 Tax=Halteromyces radiatus TaxID=101107 RepID=UPI0022206A1F|nr:uncharacterized protein BX664DRAFT_387491 [Halteromyces radiatus]KAI8084807.1 hypothetical protein BX664DRAFT_387491 [Halteromyces radiatus]
MENLLESQRLAHEVIERLEEACVQQFLTDTKTYRGRLRNEHIIDKYLNRLGKQSEKLIELYEDKDGKRQKEIDFISKPSINLDEFYQQLDQIKDHHQKYPNEAIEAPEFEFIRTTDQDEEMEDEEEDVLETLFSGEENVGRYLDLNALHGEYLNLKGVDRLDYIPYLDQVDKFNDSKVYPPTQKSSNQYRTYLDHLHNYLHSFFRRAKPLEDVSALENQAKIDFEKEWNTNGGNDHNMTNNDELFCRACQKSFTKQTVYDAHLKGKKHIKAAAKLEEEENNNSNNNNDNNTNNNNNDSDATEKIKMDRRKATALQEALIVAYMKVLDNVRIETKANVERKQALTDRERTMEQEQEDIEIQDESDEDEDEDRIYNPLKLPLGWDGKPIPYWLYKLHGLGVEYPCEICGNYVYMGRKAFDKHFQEWRHAHGMRCLGLPNSRQFHEITKISDAYALNEKLKKEAIKADVKPENMEEYEDDEGNVFNKKTYEDLKRQGII